MSEGNRRPQEITRSFGKNHPYKKGGYRHDRRNKDVLEELKKLNNKITDIQLTLENETNKNIKIIAEGHLDLSRKLDDALKVDNEKEMLMIRVNRLENELRRLKARVEEIA